MLCEVRVSVFSEFREHDHRFILYRTFVRKVYIVLGFGFVTNNLITRACSAIHVYQISKTGQTVLTD